MLGLKVETESKEFWSNLHVKETEKERKKPNTIDDDDDDDGL